MVNGITVRLAAASEREDSSVRGKATQRVQWHLGHSAEWAETSLLRLRSLPCSVRVLFSTADGIVSGCGTCDVFNEDLKLQIEEALAEFVKLAQSAAENGSQFSFTVIQEYAPARKKQAA